MLLIFYKQTVLLDEFIDFANLFSVVALSVQFKITILIKVEANVIESEIFLS